MLAVATKGTQFGDFLRHEREAKGWSRRALAQQLHRAPSVVQNIEEGISYPNVETLALMGVKFGWDFNRQVMPHFGANPQVGVENLASEIAQRPSLRRLFEAARGLSNERADLLAATAEAWAGLTTVRRKLGVQTDGATSERKPTANGTVRAEETG